MRIIPSRIHGVIDYLMGIVLIAAPWILNFEDGAQTWVPMILGASVIVYSVFTDYELGVVRAIPFPIHLAIDVLGGVVLQPEGRGVLREQPVLQRPVRQVGR